MYLLYSVNVYIVNVVIEIKLYSILCRTPKGMWTDNTRNATIKGGSNRSI